MAIIACDVDYTVVNLIPHWWKWLEGITNCEKDISTIGNGYAVNYNLAAYFEKELAAVNRCGLDFYRQDGLYDIIKPDPKSVEVLRKLAEAGHEVVFVSAIKGRHTKSKSEFLKRNYPFLKCIAFTKEKQYVASDVFIDDRCEHINKSRAPMRILYNSGMMQSEPLELRCNVASNWDEVAAKVYPYLGVSA